MIAARSSARPLVACYCCLVFAAAAPAQGTRADYQRANGLFRLTQNKVFKSRVIPHWFADYTRFWYRNDLAGGTREFVLVDAGRGKRTPAFDHARLAVALGKAGKMYLLNADDLDNQARGNNKAYDVVDGGSCWCAEYHRGRGSHHPSSGEARSIYLRRRFSVTATAAAEVADQTLHTWG